MLPPKRRDCALRAKCLPKSGGRTVRLLHGAIQGVRARFKGREKNLFDLQRSAAVNSIYVIARLLEAA